MNYVGERVGESRRFHPPVFYGLVIPATLARGIPGFRREPCSVGVIIRLRHKYAPYVMYG